MLEGAPSALAKTWDGGGGNNNFSTGANWNPNGAPLNNGTAALVFDGATRTAPNANSAWSVSSVTFASGAAGFTVGGSTLTIGSGGLTVNSTATQTINNPLTLSANQSWTAASGNLVINGSVNPNSRALTLDGGADITVNGAFSGTDTWAALTKNGTGTLTLAGNNTALKGDLLVNAGTVAVASSGALGGTSWSNVVAPGATLALQGGVTVTEGNFNVAGTGVSGGGAVRSVSGSNTLAATLTLTADTTVVAAADQLVLGGQVQLSGHTLTLSGAGSILTTQSLNSGALVVSGTGDRTFNSAVNASLGVTVDGSGSVVFEQNLNAGSSSVVVAGSGSVAFNGSQVNAGGFTVTGSSSVTADSTLNLGGGDLTLSSSGAVVLAGSAINVGNVLVSGSGTTTLETQINAGGAFTQTGTGTTTFAGDGTNYFSSVNISGGSVVLDQSSGYALQVASGNVSISGATVTFGGDNQVAGWNDVTLADGAVLNLNDTSQSIDQLIIAGDSVIDFGSGASSFQVTGLVLSGDSILTIVNWTETVDSFLANIDPGSSTLAKIIFDGLGEATWTPGGGGALVPGALVPEPAGQAALALAGLAGWHALRRRRRAGFGHPATRPDGGVTPEKRNSL